MMTARPPIVHTPRPDAGEPRVAVCLVATLLAACSSASSSPTAAPSIAASSDGQAVVLITLVRGSIGVGERHGSGAAYTDREFQGTGVTTFDPARGASFDADLTVVPGTGQTPGTLGTITHVLRHQHDQLTRIP